MSSLQLPQHDLTELEMRALAAIHFFGGFGPFAKGSRDTLIAALAAKGPVTAGVPGIYEVASITGQGRVELQRIYRCTFFKRAEDQSAFERELVVAISRSAERAWSAAESELPSISPPPRSEMN